MPTVTWLLAVICFGPEFPHAASVAEGMTPLIVMTVIALLFGDAEQMLDEVLVASKA